MAHPVTTLLPRLLALFLLGIGAVQAESLPDPMRPAVGEGRDSKAETSVDGSGLPGAAGHTVQSVILRKGQRPSANIDGQWVQLGEKVDGARVVAIRESEVVLSGPGGRETLPLTPAVDKQPTPTRAATKDQNTIAKKRGVHAP